MTTSLLAGPAACSVDAPATWRALFDGHAVSLTDRTFQPGAVAPDGSRVFGTLHEGEMASLAELTAKGPKVISPLVNEPDSSGLPASQVAAIAFDGRWLVWNPMFGDSEASSRTEVLDTQSGVRFALDRPDPFASQQVYALDAGRLVWWSSTSTAQTLHLTTLADRHDTVIATNARLGGAALVGDLVLYVDPAGRDQSGTLHAATTTTGAATDVPAPLRAVRHVFDVESSADTVAWVEFVGGRIALHTWRIGQDTITTPYVNADSSMTNVSLTGVTGDLVTFTAQEGLNAADVVINGYVASASGGATVRLPSGYRPAVANGDALVVVRLDDPRGGAPSEAAVVSARALPPAATCG